MDDVEHEHIERAEGLELLAAFRLIKDKKMREEIMQLVFAVVNAERLGASINLPRRKPS